MLTTDEPRYVSKVTSCGLDDWGGLILTKGRILSLLPPSLLSDGY